MNSNANELSSREGRKQSDDNLTFPEGMINYERREQLKKEFCAFVDTCNN